ncbi:MAG: pyridoxamine 5'-phosphate oxidase family protein [Pseudomonadota bacterium]
MAMQFEQLTEEHQAFIKEQAMFFVATADTEGYVNLSPKGMDSLRIVDERRVDWLNLTGSGNESAAHVRRTGRMTIMFCSFGEKPLILRLYGQAKVIHEADNEWNEAISHFPAFTGARQVFRVALDMVQTSCGYSVPKFQLLEERSTLTDWADSNGREGIRKYWAKKNQRSLDGRETGIAASLGAADDPDSSLAYQKASPADPEATRESS